MLIEGDIARDQLRQVVGACGLGGEGAFSRYVRRDVPLEAATREGVPQRIPAYVYRTQDRFMQCPDRHRTAWRGSHWRNMRTKLECVAAHR